MNRKDQLAELVGFERQVERGSRRTEDGWQRLQSSLAVGTAPGQVEISSEPLLKLVRTGRFVRVLGVAALGLVGAAAWVALRNTAHQAAVPRSGAPSTSMAIVADYTPTNAPAPPAGFASESVTEPPGASNSLLHAGVLASSAALAKPSPIAAESRTPAPAAATSRNTFEQELRLIKAARESVDQGQIATATSLLNQHARLFPSGVFADEREALRALAACHTAKPGQRAALAARFGRAYPASPYGERVKRACKAPPEN
jgi:hypothetical protein